MKLSVFSNKSLCTYSMRNTYIHTNFVLFINTYIHCVNIPGDFAARVAKFFFNSWLTSDSDERCLAAFQASRASTWEVNGCSRSVPGDKRIAAFSYDVRDEADSKKERYLSSWSTSISTSRSFQIKVSDKRKEKERVEKLFTKKHKKSDMVSEKSILKLRTPIPL